MDAEQAAALRAPFPPEVIGKLPKGGVMLDYVGHAATTDRLLQVDPQWTWEPMGVDAQGLPVPDSGGNLWIRLTVCGVTRVGVGDGKTSKERIGDAIRNAAMRFGVALDLWTKEDLQVMHDDEPKPARAPRRKAEASPEPVPPSEPYYPPNDADEHGITEPQRKKLGALMREAGITDRDNALAYVAQVIGREVGSRNELSVDEASEVINALVKLTDPAPY